MDDDETIPNVMAIFLLNNFWLLNVVDNNYANYTLIYKDIGQELRFYIIIRFYPEEKRNKYILYS